VRVCLVTPYDLAADGGVNRHVTSLAAALRRLGDDVRVLGPCSGAAPAGCDGVRGVVPVPANGSVARIGLLARLADTRAYLAAHDFDVVHVHEPIVPGPVRHAVKTARAPVVATFHCYSERDGLAAKLVRRLGALRLRRLAGGIAVSDHAAGYAAHIFSGPIEIIPNGVDVSRFAVRARAHRRPAAGDPLRMLFVGRHGEPRKGLPVLLEAAARLRARGIACELHVVGEGPGDRPGELARRANARFAGRVDDAELARRYAESDVFCAPSLGGESFGMVLIEAMAAGCPVVASDIPGYRLAAAGAALLVPPGDAPALAAALERVSGSADLRARMSEAGMRRSAELDWPHVAARVRAFYAGIVDEALPAALGAVA